MANNGATPRLNLPARAGALMEASVKQPNVKGQHGRPSSYTPEIAEHVLDRLAHHGESLKTICKTLPDHGLPKVDEASVRRWHVDNVAGFSPRFSRAREAQTHIWASDIMEIADDPSTESGSINRARLRVDTRKWLMSVMNPGQYGDRKQLEHSGPDGGPIEVTDPTELARALLAVVAAAEHSQGE